MNKKRQVLDTIRNLCDLKRLEFGCELKSKDTDSIHVVIFSNKHGIETLEKGFTVEETLEWHIAEIIDRDFEIIGLPVELKDLMRLMKEKDILLCKEYYYGGDIGSQELAEILLIYDFTTTFEKNLDNPELLDLIYELICKK